MIEGSQNPSKSTDLKMPYRTNIMTSVVFSNYIESFLIHLIEELHRKMVEVNVNFDIFCCSDSHSFCICYCIFLGQNCTFGYP